MLETLALTAVGLAMLFFGGEALIRGASALASRLGVSPLAIGLTVVAFGTSAPELVVSLRAALSGAGDISLGNVVGSNIANLALILGTASLIRPSLVAAKIVRIDAPIMVAASLALMGVMANGRASRNEGILLITALAAYTVFTFWESKRETRAIREELAEAAPEQPSGAGLGAGLVFLGIALLVAGGTVLVTAAIDLATALGVSQAAIGLTVVSVGTSLPEFSTSVLAAVRRQGDIAVGNVIGSNIFNILGILGVTAIVHPLGRGAITWLDMGAMLGLACVVTALISIRLRLGRVEGLLLLASFVAYAGWLLAA